MSEDLRDQKFQVVVDGVQVSIIMAVLAQFDADHGHEEEAKDSIDVLKQVKFERIK